MLCYTFRETLNDVTIASLNKQAKTGVNQTIITATVDYKALNQILRMKAAFSKLE